VIARMYRLAGLLFLAGLWWKAWDGGLLQMTVFGFSGVLVFVVFWFIAAWEEQQ
jgi:hypothetical protein